MDIKRCSNISGDGYCEISDEHMNLPIDDDCGCQCRSCPEQCTQYSPSKLGNYDFIFA